MVIPGPLKRELLFTEARPVNADDANVLCLPGMYTWILTPADFLLKNSVFLQEAATLNDLKSLELLSPLQEAS